MFNSITNDSEIVSTLVRAREKCRKIIQLYQQIRESQQADEQNGDGSTATMAKISTVLTQMLAGLRKLPEKPGSRMQSAESKQDTERILRELSSLLERAMVAEREMRRLFESSTRPAADAGFAGNAGLYGYAGG